MADAYPEAGCGVNDGIVRGLLAQPFQIFRHGVGRDKPSRGAIKCPPGRRRGGILRLIDITVRILDDLAWRLGSTDELERRALEALALEEFKLGHLTRPELRRLLGFGTRAKLDEFLTAHEVFGTYTPEDLERDRQDVQRLGF